VKPICLIPLSNPGPLEPLGAALSRAFGVACRIERGIFDLTFALDAARGQYWSTAILRQLENSSRPGERVLGVTELDLFVPVLTFVFGEAQLEGNCALVSTARLKEEFYGMPPREDLLRERLLKEAMHELGHTFGLRHCSKWECVMSSSHAVERLDLKEARFCAACRRAL
jgi:archaemetzincin